MLTVQSLREAVQRGSILLDFEMPGWRGKIDPERLALDNPRECVLGQLYGKSEYIPRWVEEHYSSKAEYVRKHLLWSGHFDGAESVHEREAEWPVCKANYHLGKFRLGLSEELCAYFGFYASPIQYDYMDADEQYCNLDEFWLAELRAEPLKVPTAKQLA